MIRAADRSGICIKRFTFGSKSKRGKEVELMIIESRSRFRDF